MKQLIAIAFLFLSIGYSITLDEALTLAESSPKAKIIKNDYEINRAKAYQGYGAVLPNLSLQYSDTQSKLPENPNSNPAMAGFSPPLDQRSKTTSFIGNQLLFSFSGLAAFKASNAALDLAEYSYQDTKQNFELEVKKAYFDLAGADNYHKLSKKIYAQAEAHAKEVSLMYDNGLAARKDLLDAKVRALEAKQNLLNGEKTYKIVLASFNTLLGRERNADGSTPAPSANIPNDLFERNFDLNELTEYALLHKPAYLNFETLIALAESDDLNAIGESLPSVFFNYSKNKTSYAKESFSQYDGESEIKSVSAGWKFYSGGSNLHKMNEKKNYREKMYEQKKITTDMLRAELENSVLDLKFKASAHLTAKEQKDLAEESYKLTELSFKNGGSTSTQVNDALAQLTAAENNYIKSLYDYEYAKAKLNYSVGKEVI